VRGHILTRARNKLLVKELDIVYRWGVEVGYDNDTPPEQIEEELVSKASPILYHQQSVPGPMGKQWGGRARGQSFVHEAVSGLA